MKVPWLKRPIALAFASVALVAITLAARLNAQPAKPTTEWFCADLLRAPSGTTPEKPVHGALGSTLEWLVLFNFADRDASAEITFYFEDKSPAHYALTLPAGANKVIGSNVNEPAVEVPMGRLHGARVVSSEPLVVQTTRAEREEGVKPPIMPGHSFLSRLGYPGPLSQRETAWAYADSHIARTHPRHKELEWITVLNPNAGRDARVKVTFHYSASKTTHEFTVGAERVRSLALEDLEAVRDGDHCGVVVQSDVPVVVEQVRRFMYCQHPAPAGTWIVTGYPIGDLMMHVDK